MGEFAVNLSLTFHTVSCYKCGITFAVDQSIRKRWTEKGETFWCPNGHDQHYTESDVQRLQRELDTQKRNVEFYRNNAASERSAREHTERRLNATKGAQTKLRNRIKNGVCPCCKRSFGNLREHMKRQHPAFQSEPQ